jgi:hypothetical protein
MAKPDEATLHDREQLVSSGALLRLTDVRRPYGSLDAVEALRRTGALIAGRYHGTWLFPAFQFAVGGVAHPRVEQLTPVLPKAENDGGWTAIFWCYQPHADLGDKTPAELFQLDPDLVISAAAADRLGPSDESW